MSASTAGKSGGLVGAWQQHHTGIVVADLDQDLAFYQRVLGFEIAFEARGMTDLFQRTVGLAGVRCDLVQLVNRATGSRLELIEVTGVPDGTDPTLPVHVGIAHTAYLVADLAAAAALVAHNGGEMLGEIVDFEEGPAAYFRTAGGTVIELEQATNTAHEEDHSVTHVR
ncbi:MULTISPECIES: VOC family protein [unclassified Leucobacter]|uniref:VOC family protein n=1 Tax=unclassified Leucobacter TaxID=2621730 RepID=UPI00165D5E9D|nr:MULTISPECIES: VOC family protein [unclassified Leucobacter]MBC9935835.1 VOC family protein [Leucobacter sp. cx-87]